MGHEHDTFKQRLIHLLLKGDRDKAKQLIVEERARAQQIAAKAAEEVKACDLFLADLDTTAEAAEAEVIFALDSSPTIREATDKDSRRDQVLALARQHAADTNEAVSVYELVKLAESRGIELGVQRNRRQTAISNILFRSGRFRKIDKGLYECLTH